MFGATSYTVLQQPFLTALEALKTEQMHHNIPVL
jgi:hypothetical protein